MTRFFLTASLACALMPLLAQALLTNCVNPSAQVDLDVNGVRARITNGGDLWWDGLDGRYQVSTDDTPAEDAPTAIFAGGLWLAGYDPGGGVKVAAQRYGRNQGRFDFYPGPLTPEGNPEDGSDCTEWDRLWKIDALTVRRFRQAYREARDNGTLPVDTSLIPTDVLGWPGLGNPYFEAVNGFALPNTSQGMAPFFDENFDGLYDPTDGDYPLFCGDQAVWTVFNDAGNVHRESSTPTSAQVEVRLLAYAYHEPDDSILHRTTFYSYQIVNRGQEDLLDLKVGHWIDVDLGCFENDQFGSSPTNELFYVYNEGGVDPDSCVVGLEGYGSSAPVNIFQVVDAAYNPLETFASTLMESVVGLYEDEFPATSSPVTADEYYNVLNGRWPDGSAQRRGRRGYDSDGAVTEFAFDGGDYNGSPWRQCQEQPTVFADIRQVYSTGPYTLQPGSVIDFTLAITTLFNVDYPDGSCPDTTAIFAAANHVGRVYETFNDCPNNLNSTSTDQSLSAAELGLTVYPNPTSNTLTLQLSENKQIDQVELFSVAGQRLLGLNGNGSTLTADLRAHGLTAGVYVYRVRTTSGALASGRVVVME